MNFKPFRPPLLLEKAASDLSRKKSNDRECARPAKKRRVSNEDEDPSARIGFGRGSQDVNCRRYPLVPLQNVALPSEQNAKTIAPDENHYTVLW